MIALILAAVIGSPTAYKAYEVKYLECKDGDTCVFQLQLGLGMTKTEDVRLCEVDTPELKTGEPGLDAKHWTQAVLQGAKEIRLFVPQKNCTKPNRCEKRSFDRLMAWVMVDGHNLTDMIIAAGKGASYTKKRCGDRPALESLEFLQQTR